MPRCKNLFFISFLSLKQPQIENDTIIFNVAPLSQSIYIMTLEYVYFKYASNKRSKSSTNLSDIAVLAAVSWCVSYRVVINNDQDFTVC